VLRTRSRNRRNQRGGFVSRSASPGSSAVVMRSRKLRSQRVGGAGFSGVRRSDLNDPGSSKPAIATSNSDRHTARHGPFHLPGDMSAWRPSPRLCLSDLWRTAAGRNCRCHGFFPVHPCGPDFLAQGLRDESLRPKKPLLVSPPLCFGPYGFARSPPAISGPASAEGMVPEAANDKETEKWHRHLDM